MDSGGLKTCFDCVKFESKGLALDLFELNIDWMHEFRQFGIMVLIFVWFIRINFQEGIRIESVWKNAPICSEFV